MITQSPISLSLIRHGQSEWNAQNRFTGWKDIGLTAKGQQQALEAAERLGHYQLNIDTAFTSTLIRAQDTLHHMCKALGIQPEIITDARLNERDYGDLTGLNKDDAITRWGKEQVHLWRRSFDVPPPNGESLKMTAERVLPYFHSTIEPLLAPDKHILIVAHGNSLRAIVMYLEQLNEKQIIEKEIANAQPLLYTMHASGAYECLK